ncbi:MAG: PQQ-binding-like beta-propeller repeat protein [Planctomycetota bacterium]|nr:PQQ-binding-like beta-propeller repeat protein [Planctomycetota bacterium]
MLPAAASLAQTADEVLAASGRNKGVLVVVGDSGADLALELAAKGKFLCRVVCFDAEALAEARERIHRASAYGDTLAAMEAAPGRLPFADGVVDLLVVLDGNARPTAGEIARLLGMDSVALIRNPGNLQTELEADARLKVETGAQGLLAFKRPSEGIDDWTHIRHGADNNPRSLDRMAGPPYQTQWLNGPSKSRSHYSGQALVYRGVFLYTDYDKPTARAYRAKQTLEAQVIAAYDADNGFPLWEARIPLAPKFREGHLNKGLFAAGGKWVFNIGAGEGCQVFDLVSGALLRTVHPGNWDWLAYADGRLLGLVDGHLRAFDPESGAASWAAPVHAKTSRGSLVAIGGLVITHHPGPDGAAVAFDLESGATVWEASQPEMKFGYGDAAGWKDLCVLSHWDAREKKGRSAALSVKDGSLVWKREDAALGINGILLGDAVLGGVEDPGVTGRFPKMSVVDVRSGKQEDLIGNRPMMRCVRMTGLRDWMCYSGGLILLDYKSKRQYWYPDFRSSCSAGAIHGNGYTFALPNECLCHHTMSGLVALSSVRSAKEQRAALGADFVKGPGAAAGDAEADWPTFRHDHARSGYFPGAAFKPTGIAWTRKFGGGLTAPILAAGKVVVGGDRHQVVALEAESGAVAWGFTAGGAVLACPAYARGAVYFGAADGWVYALDASSGQLMWRRRMLPNDEHILVGGILTSRTPINTPVLVDGETVWVCAGATSYDGMTFKGLDAASGAVRTQSALLSYSEEDFLQAGDTGLKQASPPTLAPNGAMVATRDYFVIPNGYGKPLRIERQGNLDKYVKGWGQAQGNRLCLAGDLLFVGAPAAGDSNDAMWGRGGGYTTFSMSQFGREIWKHEAKGESLTPHVYTDPHPHSYHRVPFAHGGPLVAAENYVIGAVWRDEGTDIVRASLEGSDPQKLVYEVKWVKRLKMLARAAVLTRGGYFVAGESLDAGGKKNGQGVLQALDPLTGGVSGPELTFASRPQVDGLAAGEKLLVLTTEDGSVIGLKP